MARALSGIASGGVFKRPHVVFSDEVPPDYRQAMLDSYSGSGDSQVNLDPDAWQTITDAMASGARILLDLDPSGHLEGIDFAGKTGSAQTMSNALAGRLGHAHSVKDNAWFVGFTPRRNPDIVVCILVEGGEHGRFAGRLAAQVIEAFVNKQRRLDNNLQVTKKSPPVEVGAIWSAPKPGAVPGTMRASEIRGGHFPLDPATFDPVKLDPVVVATVTPSQTAVSQMLGGGR